MGVIAERAVAAAVRVAEAHGVRVTDPVVLADGSNVLVHLRPSPVVARVATRTPLIRPEVADWLARDLAVTRYLAGRGVPVVAPSAELPAGPHRDGAHVLTFAQHVPHDPDWRPAPALVGRLLADLHAELRGYPGDLPVSGPLADLERALDLVAARLPDGALEVVRAEHAELAARWTGWETQALHGDAHPGNLLHTARGPVWFDFEDTWRGPVAWDLACLAGTSRLDGRAVVAAYPGLPAPEQLALFTRARQLFAVLWRFVIAEVVPERRADADATLRTWLIDHPH